MLGLLVDSQGQAFEAHLPTFLPLLSEGLQLQDEYPEEEEVGEEIVAMVTEPDDEILNSDNRSLGEDIERGGMESGTNGMELEHKENGGDMGTPVAGDMKVANEEGLTHDDEAGTGMQVMEERALDHFLFTVLQMVGRVCTQCAVLRSPTHRCHANNILGEWTSCFQ